MRLLLLPLVMVLGGCAPSPQEARQAEIAALQNKVMQLETEIAKAKAAPVAEAPELGAQMLELQIRHARLWQAGQGRNWLLAQFQLAELREAFAGVVATNGDH